MNNFEKLLNGEIVNGVKWFELDEVDDYLSDITEVVDGITMYSHYVFINIENTEIPYIGVLLYDPFENHDIVFAVYGAKFDRIVDFDTMLNMVSGN